MSPEQLDNENVVDQRTDIYSLGMTLYELVAGQPGFPGKSKKALMEAIVSKDPKSLEILCPDVPRDLKTIIEKAFSKEAQYRYTTASLLARDLDRFLTHRPIEARPSSPYDRLARFARRNPLVTALLATTTCLFGVIAAGSSVVALKFSRHAAHETQRVIERETELRERELSLYAQDIKLAKSAIDQGHLFNAADALLKWVPKSDQEDYRGFEWYHLWQRSKSSGVIRSFSHQSYVDDVAFSPDGKFFAQVGSSKVVKIWDLGNEVASPPMDKLSCLSMDNFLARTFADHDLLVVGSKTGDVYFWDWGSLETRMAPIKLSGDTSDMFVTSFDIHPRENLFAVGTRGGVEVYHTDSGFTSCSPIANRKGLGGAAYAAFDDLGRLLLIVEGHTHLSILDASTAETMKTISVDGEAVRSVVSKDRKLIAIALQRQLGPHREVWVEVRDVRGWKKNFQFHVPDASIRSMDFSNDGQRLVVGDTTGRIWTANPATGHVDCRPLHDGAVTSARFSPDDSTLITTGLDGFVHVIDTHSRNVTDAVVRCDDFVPIATTGAQFIDAQRVATSREATFVDIWNAFTGKYERTIELDSGFGNIMFLTAHQDEKLFAAGQMQWPVSDEIVPGRVTIWDTDDFRELGSFEIPSGVVALSMPFSPDGRYLSVSGKRVVTVIDLLHRSMRSQQFSSWVSTTAFSSDGRLLACAEKNGRIHFLDPQTFNALREPILISPANAGGPDCIRFLPENNLLVVVGVDNNVRVIDVGTGERVRESSRLSKYMTTVQVSPDGSRLIVGSEARRLHVFRTENLEELLSFDVATWAPHAGFSPDGESIVVAAGSDAFVLHGTGQRALSTLGRQQLRGEAFQKVHFVPWGPY